MKVLIIEVCRSPEIRKTSTEALVLANLFNKFNIAYELISNDGIWENEIQINKNLIRNRIFETNTDVIHFAIHGGSQGFVLRWSDELDVRDRIPLEVLTRDEIRNETIYQGKLIVSGACSSAHFANDFLKAGAQAVVAPCIEIPWPRLGLFFKTFYLTYLSSGKTHYALDEAIKKFPEYSCYRVFQFCS